MARGGQAMVETLLLLTLVSGAIAGLALYFQRGYEGYLYANAESHGSQFDPRQPFDSANQLDRFVVRADSTTKLQSPAVGNFGGICNKLIDKLSGCLPSTPGGAAVGILLHTQTDVNAEWKITSKGTTNVD